MKATYLVEFTTRKYNTVRGYSTNQVAYQHIDGSYQDAKELARELTLINMDAGPVHIYKLVADVQIPVVAQKRRLK